MYVCVYVCTFVYVYMTCMCTCAYVSVFSLEIHIQMVQTIGLLWEILARTLVCMCVQMVTSGSARIALVEFEMNLLHKQ